MIKKDKKIIHISMDKEVLGALDIVIKALRRNGVKFTKSTFLTSLFLTWLDKEYGKAILKEEKEDNA